MGLFRRPRTEPEPPMGPTPFIAEVLARIGEKYGGFDTIAPLPPGKDDPGMEIAIHIARDPAPAREPSMLGTGPIRTARAFAARTEVYDGDRLIARFDDLTSTDVFEAGS